MVRHSPTGSFKGLTKDQALLHSLLYSMPVSPVPYCTCPSPNAIQPLVPLAFHKYKVSISFPSHFARCLHVPRPRLILSLQLVACPICNFKQDISTRPDVLSQGPGGGPIQQGPPGPGQGYQQQGYQTQGPNEFQQGQQTPGHRDYYGGQGFKGPAV